MTNKPYKVSEGTKGYLSVGSDTYPITAVKVSKSGFKVWYRIEKFEADEGHDYYGTQKWKIEENPKGRVEVVHWSAARNRYVGSGSAFFKGMWIARQDPSF